MGIAVAEGPTTVVSRDDSEEVGVSARARKGAARMNTLRTLLGDKIESDIYLSTAQAAEYISLPSGEAFRKFARRHNIPLRKPSPKARTLFVRKGDIDWVMRVKDGGLNDPRIVSAVARYFGFPSANALIAAVRGRATREGWPKEYRP
jgi:hypothetical protein